MDKEKLSKVDWIGVLGTALVATIILGFIYLIAIGIEDMRVSGQLFLDLGYGKYSMEFMPTQAKHEVWVIVRETVWYPYSWGFLAIFVAMYLIVLRDELKYGLLVKRDAQ